MLATAARPYSVRGQQDIARTPEAAEPPARRPAAETAVVRVAPARRRPGFLTALLRALSAFSV